RDVSYTNLLCSFALHENLCCHPNHQVIIEQLARAAIASPNLLAILAINQPHDPFRRLVLGRILSSDVAEQTDASPLAAKKRREILFGANLPIAERRSEQKHQATAIIGKLVMARDQTLPAGEKVSQAGR